MPAIGKPISPEALTTPKTAAVEGLPAGLAACYGPSPMARLGRLMHEMDRAFSTDQSVALLLRGDKVLARIDDGTLGILKQP